MYLFFFAPISVHQIHVLTGFNASKKKINLLFKNMKMNTRPFDSTSI